MHVATKINVVGYTAWYRAGVPSSHQRERSKGL